MLQVLHANSQITDRPCEPLSRQICIGAVGVLVSYSTYDRRTHDY